MNTRYFYILRFALAGCDLVLLNIGLFGAYYLSDMNGVFIEKEIYHQNALPSSLGWLLCANLFGLYSNATIHNLKKVRLATWKTFALHSIGLLIYMMFRNQETSLHIFFLYYIVLMSIGIVLLKFAGKALLSLLNQKFDFRKTIAILSINRGGTKLAHYLRKHHALNFKGFIKVGLLRKLNNKLRSNLAAAQFKAAADAGVQEVYVSVNPNPNQMEDYSFLIEESDKHCMRLKFVPDLTGFEDNFSIDDMGEFKVLSPRKEPLEKMGNRAIKRIFDIVVSSLTILFILSWLYPVLAIIIKMQSPGPALFKQLRNGRNNKTFWCYKFRSMYIQTTDSKDKSSMVTPIGRFMRRTSLDEFPQFLNVFLGDMTVIGPRPHMVADTEGYRKLIDNYMVRHFLKPGISGWAQVNGYRGRTMNTTQMEKRVEHDIWYLENWDMLLDIKIMFLTVKNIFKGEENAF
ncbi:exopolysaccharide biosynthesis polyprenyl glycosylphosphotransferase [Pedobacter frigoris]|uniref:exopolysaccharide biosynthesis polyprenyl glycosylphosphotransferase n=1 Tax=Pedobacter frigoris TaxID=2571272 RepID=UPI00292D6DD9|nr:exopolysaccharide biosynthesis polyprenyl glycosylphosphotransferase [Pedobacter frigoris]